MTMVMVAILIACSGPKGELVEPSDLLQTPVLPAVEDTPTPAVTDEAPHATDIPRLCCK